MCLGGTTQRIKHVLFTVLVSTQSEIKGVMSGERDAKHNSLQHYAIVAQSNPTYLVFTVEDVIKNKLVPLKSNKTCCYIIIERSEDFNQSMKQCSNVPGTHLVEKFVLIPDTVSASIPLAGDILQVRGVAY